MAEQGGEGKLNAIVQRLVSFIHKHSFVAMVSRYIPSSVQYKHANLQVRYASQHITAANPEKCMSVRESRWRERERESGNKDIILIIQSLRLEASTSERISRTCVRSLLSSVVSVWNTGKEGTRINGI